MFWGDNLYFRSIMKTREWAYIHEAGNPRLRELLSTSVWKEWSVRLSSLPPGHCCRWFFTRCCDSSSKCVAFPIVCLNNIRISEFSVLWDLQLHLGVPVMGHIGVQNMKGELLCVWEPFWLPLSIWTNFLFSVPLSCSNISLLNSFTPYTSPWMLSGEPI